MIRRATSKDKSHSAKRHLILAAVRSGMGGDFSKVTGMIDGMVGVLEGEQVKDDEQDKWCLAELDKAKEEAKQTEVDIGDLGAAVEQQRDAIATVTSEIEALKAGLVELDASVAEATEQRKKEHATYLDESAANQAAVELLGMAKNRLNKFYNPTQYKEPPKKEEESFVQYKKSGGSG